MFWGLVLKTNRKYTQIIKKAFHLSQAALDVTNSSHEPVQVVLTSEGHEYILCTLRRNKKEQVALDLNFAEGDEISFKKQGIGNVHLSGYIIAKAEEDDLNFLDEDESETEEQPVESSKVKKRKLEKEVKQVNAKKQAQAEEDDSEDESAEEEEEAKEDDDEDEKEDEDEQEESSEEEEISEPKPKQPKLDKNKQNGLENGVAAPKEKQRKDKSNKNQQQQGKQKGGEKALQGGLKIEDIRVGNGPEAKPGKKVQVYYEDRLKSNNKVFDSSKTGNGFKFGLRRRDEVIKGWDIGVTGMKVGGKRRIICPPKFSTSSSSSQ